MKNQITFLILFIVLCFGSLHAQVNQEWAARYNGPGKFTDYAYSLAVDSSGNIYVTGYSGVYPNYDYATIKYNSSGDSLWVARYNSMGNNNDYASSLAVDGSGNVYVTGVSHSVGFNYDYVTIKYNSSGDSLWVARYNGFGRYAPPVPSLVVDDSGNAYVAGYTVGSGSIYDYATIKYNSSGVQQWVQRYRGTYDIGDFEDDVILSLAVDHLGNVYVTGYSSGSGSSNDYATIKYNSSGDSLWVARYNGPGNNWDGARSIAVDSSGNVYVTGISNNGGLNYDYATIKYNSSGDLLWVARYNGRTNSWDQANSIAVDGSGNVYVTGRSQEDYATIKYNSSGDSLWVARYNGPGNSWDEARSLAIDGSGNVYVTGSSYGDYATIKYNSLGDSLWVARYNGPGNSWDVARSLAVDVSGNVYVTGASGLGNYDYATIKYSQLVGILQTYNSVPEKFSLSQNYPNPFNPKTIINYQCSMFNFVSLKVYDVLGNEVATLVNEKQNAGSYSVEFNGNNLASGIYYYKLITDNFYDTKKMTLIK